MDNIVKVVLLSHLLLLISYTVQQPAIPEYGPIPQNCQPRPELMPLQCCIFPPFFTFEVAKECKAHFARIFVLEGTNVTGFRRIVSRDCDHWECILGKYHLLNSEGLLNDDKYFVHLNKWVELNPPFGEAMLDAKIHCKQLFRARLPLEVCMFFDFQKCIRNHVKLSCPTVVQTQVCLEQQQFFKECKAYYM